MTRTPGPLLVSAGSTDIRLVRGFPKIPACLYPLPIVLTGRCSIEVTFHRECAGKVIHEKIQIGSNSFPTNASPCQETGRSEPCVLELNICNLWKPIIVLESQLSIAPPFNMTSFFRRLSKSKTKEEAPPTGYEVIGGSRSSKREPTLTDRMKEPTASQKRKVLSASTLYQLRRDHKIKAEKPQNGFRSILIYQFDPEDKALANLKPAFPDELASPETLEFFGFDQVIAHEIWALYRGIVARPDQDDPSGEFLLVKAGNFAERKYFDLWAKSPLECEGNWSDEMGFNPDTQATLGEMCNEIKRFDDNNEETTILQTEALSLKKKGEKLTHELLCECTYGNHHSDYNMMIYVKQQLLGMSVEQEAAMKKMLSKSKFLMDRAEFGEAAGIDLLEGSSKCKGKEESSHEIISKVFTNHLDDAERKLVEAILLKVGTLCISSDMKYLETLTPEGYVGLLDLLTQLGLIKFDSSPVYSLRIMLHNRLRCLESLERDLARQLNLKLPAGAK